VAVLKDGAAPIEAQPLDVGPDGARLQFDTPGGPDYVMGQLVNLSFSSSRIGKALVTEARVVRRMEEKGHRTYAFRFTNHHRFEGHAPEEIYRLLNRRGSFRVNPPEEEPIDITLKPEEGGPLVRARLIDISATGLGARTSVDVEATLVATLRVTVMVALPTHPDPVSVPGIIRSRVLAGAHVRYGIAFDFAASDHAESKQNAIIDYVMRRQREELRQTGR
jgi:c-di-GMP-binding flagellar brake protein YcgR